MRQRIFSTYVCSLMLSVVMVGSLLAAITPEQKKELKEIGLDAIKIGPLVAKKKFGEAATAIKGLEDRLSNFISGAGIKENDPALKTVRAQLEKVKSLLERAAAKGGGVTFEKNVASIFAKKCVECHSEEPKAGLRLDTFEGLEKGGNSRGLIIPGEAEASVLIQRLITPEEEHRMPYGKEPLSEKEIESIAAWIGEGAKFDGDKTATMTTLAKSALVAKPIVPAGKAPIVKETGKETVHFMQDIMPEMVDTCGRCHNDTQKRSGFSVMSFEKLMKGGDSGAVIVAGSLENSRLWRLVNGDDTPVMPAGNQTGITRKWYDNLKTWILEGAKFDGADPKKNFPSQQDREAAALAKFTPEQWLERRKKASEEEWKKTFPNAEPNRRESTEFLIYGDVSDERLGQVEKWANEQAEYLRQTFKVKDASLWRGKLAVFVFKERFGYEEFNNSVHRREVPREVMGHSQVNSAMEDAYIAVQDIGDTATETSPGMQVNLMENVTSAFFKRGGPLPDWLVRGAGLAIAHQKAAGNPYLATMPRLASKTLQESNLTDPELIFVEGTFSPVETGPIGCTLVEFLLKRGNLHQFGQFVQKLQSGATTDAAIKAIYRTDGNALASLYVAALPSAAKKGKK